MRTHVQAKMSDLPKLVGRSHRAALRNHLAKNPIQKDEEMTASSKQEIPYKENDVIGFNKAAEPHAIEYIKNRIQKDGNLRFKTACDLIALEVGISVRTAELYLRKYSVDHPKAVFQISDGMVSLRGK